MVFSQELFGAITRDLVQPAQPVLGAGRRRAPLFQGGSWRKDDRRRGVMEPGRPGVEPEARLTPLRKARSESLITEWRLQLTQITFLLRRAVPCGPVPPRGCVLELFANIRNDNKRRVKASTAQRDPGRPSLPYPSQARSPRVREVSSPAQLSPRGHGGSTV